MKRGDIWDIDIPGVGIHPGVVLTNGVLLNRIGIFIGALLRIRRGQRALTFPSETPRFVTRASSMSATYTRSGQNTSLEEVVTPIGSEP